MQHRGTCRCGAVAFEVDGDHAGERHDVLWAVPRARIRMRPPEPAIGAFTYSGWLVGHRFCAACGMHLFGEEIVEEGATGTLPMAYVNRECLDGACESAPAETEEDHRRLEPEPSE